MNAIIKTITIIVIECLIWFICGHLAKKTTKAYLRFIAALIKMGTVLITIFLIAEDWSEDKSLGKTIIQSSSLIIAVATFAAQQALGNVISGFSISLSRPFEIGQKIKVISGGTVLAEGIVSNITLRHTIIKTFNGNDSIIPNKLFDDCVIENTNYSDEVGNFFEVGVGYNDNFDEAINIIKKLCLEEPLITKTVEPFVSRYDASAVIIKTTIWTKTLDDNFKACSDLRKKLPEEFKKAGISIPYNIVTIDKNE